MASLATTCSVVVVGEEEQVDLGSGDAVLYEGKAPPHTGSTPAGRG